MVSRFKKKEAKKQKTKNENNKKNLEKFIIFFFESLARKGIFKCIYKDEIQDEEIIT
jgi:hypothetical protein